MKNVVIDARMAGPEPHGIGRYVEGLLEGLVAQRVPYRLVALVGKSPSLRLQKLRASGVEFEIVQAPFLNPFEILEIPRALRRVQASLYHSPSFSSLLFCPCDHVLTLHDLNHLTYGTWADRLYYRAVLKPFARRARAVMTVSNTAREEISRWLGWESSKVTVVRNPIDLLVGSPDAISELGGLGLTPEKFFLCVANLKPHKNVSRLLRAFARYRAEGGSWPFVVTIRGTAPQEGVLFLGNLGGDDGEKRLANLLGNAGALVSPSLYEGFGRPPVEAVLLETPVIASDIPVYREALDVAGPNEVCWVPPLSEEGWVAALKDAEWGRLAKPSDETRWDLAERHEAGKVSKDLDAVYRGVLGIEG